MLLRTAPAVPGTVNPTPTSAVRARQWRRKGAIEPDHLPALDVAGLAAKYGVDPYTPRMFESTFKVPLAVGQDVFDRERSYRIYRWIDAMQKRGWYWLKDRRIDVYPGVYPAHDLLTGVAELDQREFIARAWFQRHQPNPVTVELRPEWLQPTY